jgi:hypothetical protein
MTYCWRKVPKTGNRFSEKTLRNVNDADWLTA